MFALAFMCFHATLYIFMLKVRIPVVMVAILCNSNMPALTYRVQLSYLVYKFPEIRAWCDRQTCCATCCCQDAVTKSPRRGSPMNSHEGGSAAKRVDAPPVFSSEAASRSNMNGSDKSSNSESKAETLTQEIKLTQT